MTAMKALRALSIKQPFAELIVRGVKDVENRAWATSHRGRLLIHASKAVSGSDMRRHGFGNDALPTGAFVGVVDLVDCTDKCGSRWHLSGQQGWYLADPRRLSRPVRFTGNVGLLKVPAARVRSALLGARRPDPSSTLTLFSFGYFGWGNAIDELLAITHTIEAERGFEPPIFVDIRYRRAVRAQGFREDGFARRLGHENYRWMKTLGNRAIGSGKPRIEIAAPDAAHQLLDLALDAHQRKRRVIFFCACESPCDCHRHVVGKLVVRAARKRREPVNVVEWPGTAISAGVALDVNVSPNIYDGAVGDSIWMPLPRSLSLAQVGVLSWGAVGRVRARGRAPALVVLGSVRPRDGRWHIETYFPQEESEQWTVVDALRVARRERLRLGHAPLA